MGGTAGLGPMDFKEKKSKGVLEDLFEKHDERLNLKLAKLKDELKETLQRERRLREDD